MSPTAKPRTPKSSAAVNLSIVHQNQRHNADSACETITNIHGLVDDMHVTLKPGTEKTDDNADSIFEAIT